MAWVRRHAKELKQRLHHRGRRALGDLEHDADGSGFEQRRGRVRCRSQSVERKIGLHRRLRRPRNLGHCVTNTQSDDGQWRMEGFLKDDRSVDGSYNQADMLTMYLIGAKMLETGQLLCLQEVRKYGGGILCRAPRFRSHFVGFLGGFSRSKRRLVVAQLDLFSGSWRLGLTTCTDSRGLVFRTESLDVRTSLGSRNRPQTRKVSRRRRFRVLGQNEC